jgi:hypothetical protein
MQLIISVLTQKNSKTTDVGGFVQQLNINKFSWGVTYISIMYPATLLCFSLSN